MFSKAHFEKIFTTFQLWRIRWYFYLHLVDFDVAGINGTVCCMNGWFWWYNVGIQVYIPQSHGSSGVKKQHHLHIHHPAIFFYPPNVRRALSVFSPHLSPSGAARARQEIPMYSTWLKRHILSNSISSFISLLEVKVTTTRLLLHFSHQCRMLWANERVRVKPCIGSLPQVWEWLSLGQQSAIPNHHGVLMLLLHAHKWR